jgi:rare lipoprotein A
MQTKLRVIFFVCVASLLGITPMSAASQGTKVQAKAKKLKMVYIGTASWYGADRQGKKMANGQPFDCHKFTAASWYFPLGTTIRVVNVKNGESVVVTITDRGPNLRLNRIVDLSEAAAVRLDYVGQGLTPVFLYPVRPFDTSAAANDSVLTETSSSPRTNELEAKAMAEPM